MVRACAEGSARGWNNTVGQPQATRSTQNGQAWSVEDALEQEEKFLRE